MNMDWISDLAKSIAEPKTFDRPEYQRTYDRNRKAAHKKFREDHIGLLDFETDPFDNAHQDVRIEPFICCLYYGGDFVIIQDDDASKLIDKIFVHIEALDEPWIFYAHNGGRFDFRFMEYKLRGRVNYKGSSLMRAEVGKCEIRDSSHILPIALKEYNKDVFDYEKMRKKVRHKHMPEIIEYVKSDCENTLALIRKFVQKNGFKISIGAAALAQLRKDYKIESVTDHTDKLLRKYFRGGRVECLAGAGYFEGEYLYLDVNSMYPDVMANVAHPIGSQYIFRNGMPNADTFFLTLECENNGALLAYNEASHELTSEIRQGVFHTTIHEYKAAMELGLIWNVKVLECVDCMLSTDFSKFVLPLYHERQGTKHQLELMKKAGEETTSHYLDIRGEDLLLKLLMNNAYGKTAQNPRKFKEYVFTDPREEPDKETYGTGWNLETSNSDYFVWSRPNPDIRFLNVGTGASITGAARAKLLRAINAAVNPIYCDTDSLVCEALPGFEMDNEILGAWKIEAKVRKMIVAGKKLYAFEDDKGKQKFRSKGTNQKSWTWDEMLALLQGDKIVKVNFAPTLTRGGGQAYVSRTVRATARRKIPAKLPIERKAHGYPI